MFFLTFKYYTLLSICFKSCYNAEDLGGNGMYRKITVFFFFCMLCFPIAANRGNSLSFKKVNYKISYTILDTQHLINELFDYLSLCYTVKIDKPMEETIKYNKKKIPLL